MTYEMLVNEAKWEDTRKQAALSRAVLNYVCEKALQ